MSKPAPLGIESLEQRLVLASDELLRATPDANSDDPYIVAKAVALGNDPTQIFNFLRDQVGYESYVGSLRGARGTLWSEAGNALDRASLMVALLRASGTPARYVQGMLPDPLARQLILSMFPEPLRIVGCLDAGTELGDPANDPQLLAEARDHYWVEFDAGSGFTAADPSFPGAAIGQTFAIPLRAFAEVSDILRHKVTIGLERELTIPGVALFTGGSAQDVATVLDETFNTVELVGKSVSVGHFVHTQSISAVFSATTHTYAPYLLVNQNDGDVTDDHLIRGQDYQEFLTNFPLGSQILTGVFLEISALSPEIGGTRRTETVEKTIFDRIGFVAREIGGAAAFQTGSDALPALDDLDIVTLVIASSAVPEPLNQLAALTDTENELDGVATALEDTDLAVANAALQPAIRLTLAAILEATSFLGSVFLARSEEFARAISDNTLTRMYFDSPRVIAISSKIQIDPLLNEETATLEVDILRNVRQSYARPGQAEVASKLSRFVTGIGDSVIENEVLKAIASAGEVETTGAMDVFLQAVHPDATNLRAIDETGLAALSSLELSEEAKARITRSVHEGRVVQVPSTMVDMGGRSTVAWLEIDPQTGSVVAVSENGAHQGLVERVALLVRNALDVSRVFGRLGSKAAQGVIKGMQDAAMRGDIAGLKRLARLAMRILDSPLLHLLVFDTVLGPAFAAFQINFAVGLRVPLVDDLGRVVGDYNQASAVAGGDPPVGSLLYGVPPSPDFVGLGSGTSGDATIGIIPDPLFTVPVGGALVPTVFRVGINNGTPTTHTFALNLMDVPAGFLAQTTVPQITIPAGQTAEVGICLVPTSGVPGPGTAVSFAVQAMSTTNPAITATDAEAFVVPEVHGVTLLADPPPILTTIPGAPVTTMLMVTAIGNVPENVTFTVNLPPGLTLNGLDPILLAVGETVALPLTLIPASDTPLNSTLLVTVTANFGTPDPQTAAILVDVVVPGARSIAQAAMAANRFAKADLANRLHDLSIALTNLVQDCENDMFKSQSLAELDAVIGLLRDDSTLVGFVVPLTAARDQLAAAGSPDECLLAVNNLGQTLDRFGDTITNISEHNLEVFLLPNSLVAQPQTPTEFELRIHNISASVVSTTYNVTIGALPPGVSGMLSQYSVTLARDEFASVMVTITQDSTTELLPFDFSATVSADGFPDVARTVHGSFTARNEFVSIVSVTATPPFTDAGGQLAVAARVLNAVNREQFARASFVVKDSSGVEVGPPSAPVDVMLTVQTSLVTVPLGMIDTTGFANGSYTIEVTLTDMSGQPIPGATGIGNFLVGSPVTASLDVSPDVLPPGTSTVTNTLAIEAIGPVASSKPITLLSVQPIFRARGVATRNNLAYVCGFLGIEIIDYSDPSNLVVRGTIPGTYTGCRIQDNVLLAMRPVGREFILDVYALQNTPLAPPRIGGSEVINYDLQSDLKSISGHALVTQFNICFFIFAADIYEQMGDLLSIALNLDDVNNPTTAAPTLESVLFNTHGDATFDPTDQGCAESGGDHNVWGVALSNPQTAYLATTTAAGDDTQTGIGRVQVVDIANPASPAVVRELDIPGTVQAIGIAVSGTTGVVIGSTAGFQDNPNGLLLGTLTVTTLDLTDPRDPQIVASRTLGRLSGTLLTNTATLGDGLFAFSNQGFDGTADHPAVLIIDASDRSNPIVTETAIPLQLTPPNSLLSDGDLLFTTDDSGLSIYRIGDIPGLPITARVQVPNGTGVAIVAGSFNTPPTAIIPGVDFDTLVWDLSLTSPDQIETFSWNSIVSDMQAGESRAVTLDTTIYFGFQGATGQVKLPPQSVVSEQIVALDPSSRSVRPGEPATYKLTLRNPAASSVTYDLSLQGVTPEWVDLPTSVMVQAGASADLALTLTSDAFAPLGELGFVVTASAATGAIGSVHGSLILDGEPLPPDPESYGIVLTIAPDHATAGQGTAANFVLRLTNTGSATDTFMLLADLPAGFAGTFEQPSVEVPPGASNFRELSLVVVAPRGTVPGNYDFSVTAASSTQDGVNDIANSRVVIVGAGVDVSLSAASVAPGGTLRLTVTNTGQAGGTFDLALAGPAALVATLGTNSVTLATGASQVVSIAIGGVDFAVPGPLLLTATATARSEPAVSDSATASVNIPTTTGLAAEFTPATMDLPAPGPTSFLLMVENLGNTEDSYTATIMSTSGPVAASLIGLDGLPAQTVPVFRLPGLATGAILVNANLTAFGQGGVTVQVRSRANAGVVASATATVMSDLEVDPCEPAPVVRAAVAAGNVRAQIVSGRLVITGDRLLNNIRIAAGPEANSLCIIGNDGTTVNGRSDPELITGVTGSVFITMSGASDSVFFDGSIRPIILPGDLNVRMNSTRDTLRLDHLTVEGKTRIRTGRGRDLVELVDTVLTGRSSIFTGRGDDTLRIHTSQFMSDILLNGYLGIDSIDAGTRRRPNSNGNLFSRPPRVEFESPLS